jgi:hypothetical protein
MNSIIDPTTLQSYSIFSDYGKQLLKQFIKLYQSGGNSEESFEKPELRRASSKTSIDDDGGGGGGAKEQVRISDGAKVGELDKEVDIHERMVVHKPNNCCKKNKDGIKFEQIYTVNGEEYNTDIFSPPISYNSFKNNHATSKTQSANYSMGAFNTFNKQNKPLNDARILIECRKCGVAQSTLDKFIKKVRQLQSVLTCNYTIGFEFELTKKIPEDIIHGTPIPKNKKIQRYIDIAKKETDEKQPPLSEHVSAVKFDYEQGTHFEFVSNIIEVPAKISDTGGGTKGTKGKTQTRTSQRRKRTARGRVKPVDDDVTKFNNDLNAILTDIYKSAKDRLGTGQVTFGVKLEDMSAFFDGFSALGPRYQRAVNNWRVIEPNWVNHWLGNLIPKSKRKNLFLNEETAIYGLFCLIIHYFATFSAFTVFEDNTGMKGSPDLMVRNRFCDMYKLLSKEEQELFKKIMNDIKGSETYMYMFLNSFVDCGYFKCTLYEWLQTIVNSKLSTEFLNIYNTTLNIANIDCVMKKSDVIIEKLNKVPEDLTMAQIEKLNITELDAPLYNAFFNNMHTSFNTPKVTKLLQIISKLKDIYQKSSVNGYMSDLEALQLSDFTTVLLIPKGVEMLPIHEKEYGKKITIDAEFILIFLVFSLYNAVILFFEVGDIQQNQQRLTYSIRLIDTCNKILDGTMMVMLDIVTRIKEDLYVLDYLIYKTWKNTGLKIFNADEYLFTNLPELSLESQKDAIKANREAEALAAKLGGITPESLDTVEYVEADAVKLLKESASDSDRWGTSYTTSSEPEVDVEENTNEVESPAAKLGSITP